jgi:Na+/H+ antiporter NhaC
MTTATSTDFLSSLTGAVAVVPIIIALVQVIKMTMPKLDNRFAPILSIAMGVLVAFLLKHDTANLTNVILEGVLYGLSASGLYSGITTMKPDSQSGNANQTSINAPQQPTKTQAGQNTTQVTKTEQATTTSTTDPYKR